LFLKMVMQQPIDGTFQDGAESETLCVSRFSQLVTEMPGDAAHKGHGHVWMVIGTDVIAEKVTEIICHQMLDGRVRQVVMDERSEGCQKTVGHRFTIDSLDNICHRQMTLRLKLQSDIFRQNAFV